MTHSVNVRAVSSKIQEQPLLRRRVTL